MKKREVATQSKLDKEGKEKRDQNNTKEDYFLIIFILSGS